MDGRRDNQFCRLIHGTRVMGDRLVIGSLDFFLDQFGVSWADMIEE